MIKDTIPLLDDSDQGSVCGARPYNAVAKAIRNIRSETLSIGLGPDGGLRIEADYPQGGGGGGEHVDVSTLPFATYKSGDAIYINGGYIYIGTESIWCDGVSITAQMQGIMSVYIVDDSSQQYGVRALISSPIYPYRLVFPLSSVTSDSIQSRSWMGGNITLGGIWI